VFTLKTQRVIFNPAQAYSAKLNSPQPANTCV
jgi:hypothetical protein